MRVVPAAVIRGGHRTMRKWREIGWWDRFAIYVATITLLIVLALVLAVSCNGDKNERTPSTLRAERADRDGAIGIDRLSLVDADRLLNVARRAGQPRRSLRADWSGGSSRSYRSGIASRADRSGHTVGPGGSRRSGRTRRAHQSR